MKTRTFSVCAETSERDPKEKKNLSKNSKPNQSTKQKKIQKIKRQIVVNK